MSKLKMFASGMMASVMLAGTLAGCTSGTSSANAGSNAATQSSGGATGGGSAVTLVCAFPGQESVGAKDVNLAINEKLKADGLNFQVDVKYLDSYWDKLAMDIAGGTVYDVAWAHASTLSNLVAKKVYQPVDAAMAEFGKELVANTPDYVLKGGAINGQQYAFPRVIPTADFNNTLDIRADLRKKYDLPEIKTVEDLEAYFAAVAENEPDMYVLVGPNMNSLNPVYANFFFPLGDGGIRPLYIDPSDPELKVKSFWDSAELEKIATTFKNWRDKGWQPADSSRVENGDIGFDYGKVAAVASNVMRASERIDVLKSNVPDAEVETVVLDAAERRIFIAGDNMLAVPSTSKNPNEAVQLINWIKKDQANYDLWSYGVEGVNYVLDGNAVDTSNTLEDKKYSMNTWMWNDVRLARFSSKYPQEAIDRIKTWDDNAVVTPFVGFTVDLSKIKAQVSQILAIVDEYSENVGKGVVDIRDVRDEVMKKMNDAGLQDVIAEVQRQVDEQILKK